MSTHFSARPAPAPPLFFSRSPHDRRALRAHLQGHRQSTYIEVLWESHRRLGQACITYGQVNGTLSVAQALQALRGDKGADRPRHPRTARRHLDILCQAGCIRHEGDRLRIVRFAIKDHDKASIAAAIQAHAERAQQLNRRRQARRRAQMVPSCHPTPLKSAATTDTYETVTLPGKNNSESHYKKPPEAPLAPQPPARATAGRPTAAPAAAVSAAPVLVDAHASFPKSPSIPAFIPEEEIAAAEASFATPQAAPAGASLTALFANLQRLQIRNGWAPDEDAAAPSPEAPPTKAPTRPADAPPRQGAGATKAAATAPRTGARRAPGEPLAWSQAQQLLAQHQHTLGNHPINLAALVNVGASYELTRQALDITAERLRQGGLRNPGAFALGVLRNIHQVGGTSVAAPALRRPPWVVVKPHPERYRLHR